MSDETIEELAARLDRVIEAAKHSPPRREGPWYVWDLNGREWRVRPFTDPTGLIQTPVLPGVYRDQHGRGHANVHELCRLVELEETEDNLAEVVLMLAKAVGSAGIELIVR